MAFYLALKNIFSRKSSIAIILFVSFSVSLLVLSNAFFDGTGQGIEKTFVQSFTGDVVIRPKVNFPLSLLGDETPATGAFSEIPQIIPFTQVKETVSSYDGISSVLPQLSSQAVINVNGSKNVCIAFGVDSKAYFDSMPGLTLVEGSFYKENEKGIMLSEDMIESLQKASGKKYAVGDTVQLLAGNGISFSLRAVTLTGIYKYQIQNDVLKRICLISPAVLRELTGISQTLEENAEISENQNDLIDNTADDWDIDDLFVEDEVISTSSMTAGDEEVISTDSMTAADGLMTAGDGSMTAGDEEVISTGSMTAADGSMTDTYGSMTEGDGSMTGNVTSWNYLVCRTNGNPKKIAKKLNRVFRKKGWEVEAVTWRSAAGLSAMYLYWIHNIFTLGVIVLLGVGFIIVNNTLTVSALDRIPETGTLRAIGGSRRFIILQFMTETMILTIISGILGFILGSIFNQALNKMNITFTNIYLVQLFGGTTLTTLITFSNFVKCMALSVVLGIIGWIYPVKISMDVNPVQAMQRGI